MTPAYPRSDTWDSVTRARVQAVASFGFTERQCRFLVTVMVHAGCFLERQYCTFYRTCAATTTGNFIGRTCHQKWRLANARPEPVLRYCSNRVAHLWLANSMAATSCHGRSGAVCMDPPRLCVSSRCCTSLVMPV